MLIGPAGPLLFADHVEQDGEGFFAAVRPGAWRGWSPSAPTSRYQPGRRSPDWIKVKSWLTQSCAVAGWTAGHGRRGHLGSLVLALRDARGWVHCGQVGTGFGEAEIADLLRRLEPLRRPTSPLVSPPDLAEPVTWVEPRLVCEVRHAGWTRAGVLRHPAFLSLREDVGPEDCVREVAAQVTEVLARVDGAVVQEEGGGTRGPERRVEQGLRAAGGARGAGTGATTGAAGRPPRQGGGRSSPPRSPRPSRSSPGSAPTTGGRSGPGGSG